MRLHLTDARAFPSAAGDNSIIIFALHPRPRRQQVGRIISHQQRMWQSYIFGMHWKHEGKMYYDELPAESKEEAAEYFINHCRDDVSLVRVELVGPDEPGTREYAHSPLSPFSPLKARRRMDKDEDAR